METYELRQSGDALLLTGGRLEEPLAYPAGDAEAPIRLVGFLSQRDGSVLRIFNGAGEVVHVQSRPATAVIAGAVGGLAGPR